MPDDGATASDTPAQACESRDYRRIESPAEAALVVSRISGSEFIGTSFYAIGEDSMTARWSGLALSVSDCEGWFIDLPADSPERRAELLAVIEPLFSGSATLVSHDVKRGYLLLKKKASI